MKKIFLLCCLFFTLGFSKQRLVVLDPASIETLYMLGAEKEIVGIAPLQHTDIYPKEETSKLPNIGNASHVSLEEILNLKPTLVILNKYYLNLEDTLKVLGIKTLYMQTQKLDDMKTNIKILAKIVNKEKEGKKLIEDFEAKLESLRLYPFNQTGIYLYSGNPLMGFSDNSLIGDILKLIGIKNLVSKNKLQRCVILPQKVLEKDPEIIIFGTGINKDELLEDNPLLKKTKAHKNGQIYFNPNSSILLRLSPKIVERIEEFKENLRTGKF
ncbi:ABC transporter substrate-binding protein [Campylobacter sp. MIT 21-1685]|uniref:ABC transporter substrate-binding protein n=1 Tax=unclassified Campylobacter TaxID=2593542 RepID=UPI00224B62A6|nr:MULTISPECIES: ABC transporter substrate-binding protein [unclassified Campylobacter]MCX2682689.1 ABC transporter substrate-binding protein [Campylobacter sp. MIT 21-1684]MCX2750969.1 ABC transporter substrate-binding protein [Campylobacter sp. MIT 21-1682]MCX2807098.1 ABC transporter substrate-binding protein [Campylobacter sp. MIT 21-1685]